MEYPSFKNEFYSYIWEFYTSKNIDLALLGKVVLGSSGTGNFSVSSN